MKTVTIFGIYSDNIPGKIFIGNTKRNATLMTSKYKSSWRSYSKKNINVYHTVFEIYKYGINVKMIEIEKFTPENIFETSNRVREAIKRYIEAGWDVVNDRNNDFKSSFARNRERHQRYVKNKELTQKLSHDKYVKNRMQKYRKKEPAERFAIATVVIGEGRKKIFDKLRQKNTI